LREDESLNTSVGSSPRGIPANSPVVVALAVAVVVLVLMGGFVLMYQVAYANRIYPGVKAFGHDLGGYSRDEARSVLQNRLDEMAQRQLTLTAAEKSWTLTARELGLRADIAPVLDSAFLIGREGNLFGRFSTQFGLWRAGRTFEQPTAAFDQALQTALLQRLAGEFDRPVVEARLSVTPDLRVELQEPRNGRSLDLDASRQRLQDALALPAANGVDLVIREIAPRNAANNFPRARDQAERILSSPITLKHGERTWTLDREQLASILRFDERLDAVEAAYLDRAPLAAWTETLADAVEQSPQDARFSWSGGQIEVLRPSRDGVELDVPTTVDAVRATAYTDQRLMNLPVKVTRPAVPMEDRHNLGFKELIEQARTPYAGSVQAKQENISLAAKRLNGVVVPPGGTFSFNKELGSTSLDAGFKVGWGITTGAGGNVKTVPSVAGGICQVATTLFHAVFWSGYQIEERNWHLYWISSYTSKGVVGLDATVDEEAGLDFQFINPTKHHLLVQSWVDNSQHVNFALYGTKPSWTVKVDPSVKTEVVPAETDNVYVEEESTVPEGNRLQVERATDGFVVTNVRHVLENGEDRTLRLVSRYRPSRNVVLVGTGGKPASGRTVVETNKPAPPAQPKPTAPAATATPAPTAPTPGRTPTQASARTSTPASATRTASSESAAPTATPVRPTSVPTKPSTAATSAPASKVAPPATPSRR
jgi:vancomycin resistance protein YoaR